MYLDMPCGTSSLPLAALTAHLYDIPLHHAVPLQHSHDYSTCYFLAFFLGSSGGGAVGCHHCQCRHRNVTQDRSSEQA